MRSHKGGLILLILLFSLCSLNANAFKESLPEAGRTVRSLSSTTSLSSVTTYYDVPVNVHNSDPFCYGRSAYSDNPAALSSITSKEFSFVFQFINQAESSSHARTIFSLDNGLDSTENNYIMASCIRGAYDTDAAIPMSCQITTGSTTKEETFTLSIYKGNLVSLYVGFDLTGSKAATFYLFSEGTNTSETFSLTNVATTGSYKFPSRITIGTAYNDLTNCSRGLQVIKARYYTNNYFASSFFSSLSAAKSLFQDDGVISLAIMAPPSLDSSTSIPNLGETSDPTTIILGQSLSTSTDAPTLSESLQAFKISTTRDASCNAVSKLYLTAYTKVDLRNVVISVVFKYASGGSNQVLLQRVVNSLGTVDFAVSYDFSNTRFTIVLNGQSFNTASFPAPSDPTLYTIQIKTGIFNQLTEVIIANVATGVLSSHVFDSVLHRSATELYTLYVGEYVQQPSLCNTEATPNQNGEIELSNLVITAGQFDLTTTGCPTGCAVCGGLLSSNYRCFGCSASYYYNILKGTCSESPACNILGTLDICQSCSVSSCTYCLHSTLCEVCSLGHTLGNDNTTCDAGCATSALSSAGCNACDDTRCYACESNKYLYNSQCVNSCPSGYFANSATKTCEHCATNCSICTGPAKADCTTCLTGYEKSGGYCQLKTCGPLQILNMTTGNCMACPNNHYYVAAEKSCISCNSTSLVNSSGICVPCASNQYYNPSSNNCANCALNQFYNSTNSSCENCSNAYQIWNVATNVCEYCPKGNQFYDVDLNKCQNCSLSNQFFATSNHTCTPCGDGRYFFNYTANGCAQVPKKNQYWDTTTNKIESCSTGLVYNGTNCTTCPGKNEIYDSETDSCTKCPKKNQYFDQGACVFCNVSSIFSEETGQCVLCGNTSKFYFDNTTDKCTTCELPNQYFHMPNASCISCPKSNEIFDNTTNGCVACGNGDGAWFYDNTMKACAKCSKINQYWSTDDNECKNCSVSNQYYNGTQCVNCGLQNFYYDATVDACVVCTKANQYWDTTSGACKNCSSPFMHFDTATNSCKPCETEGKATANNYFNFSTNSCVICPFKNQRYVPSDDKCISCEKNQIFNLTTNSCAFCFTKNQRYTTESDACTSCEFSNQIIDTTDGNCKNCSLTNQFFVDDATGGKCGSCTGPNQYYDPEANSGNGGCVACAGKNQFFSSGQDKCDNCSLSSYFNVEAPGCALCGSNRAYFNVSENKCLNCTGKNQYFDINDTKTCINCSVSYHVFNDSMNVCTQCFYNNSYFDPEQGDCVECPQTNMEYSKANATCQLCGLKNTFFNKSRIVGGQCETCPYSNQIYSLELKECVACNNSKGNCFFNNITNDCDVCPLDNQKWDIENHECVKPTSKNLVFDTSTLPGAFVSCGPNYFFDETIEPRGGCEKCPIWYQVFSNATNNCTLCGKNNTFFNNQTGSCGSCDYNNQYFNLATEQCQDCAKKNMYFSVSDNTCVKCPFKQQIYNKTANGTYAGSCVYCPGGNQYYDEGNDTCITCPYTNQYWDESKGECVNCSKSNEIWNPEKGECEACNPNQFWDLSTNGCKDCNYTNEYYDLSSGSCVACRPNQFYDSAMGTPPCRNCSLTNQIYNKSSNTCENCSVSNQFYNDSAGTCWSCAGNQGYNASPNENTCWTCPSPNEFYNTETQQCQPCGYSNMYFDTTNNNCTECLPNQRYDVQKKECVNCNPNQYFDKETDACKNCSLSNEYYNTTTWSCTNCSSNAYYNPNATGYCEYCESQAHYYEESQRKCIFCDRALIWNNTINQCVPCAGNKGFNLNTNECETCNLSNQYFDWAGTTRCQNCSINQYFNTTLDRCTNCPKGNEYYVVTGYWVPGTCTPCQQHYSVNPNGTITNPCYECEKNQFVHPATGNCTYCEFNAFYDPGNDNCTNCTGVNEYWDTTCKPCKANQFVNLKDRRCQDCAANAYFDSQAKGCVTCPLKNQFVVLSEDGKTVNCTNCSVANAYFDPSVPDCVSCASNEFLNPITGQCLYCGGKNKKFNHSIKACDFCPTNHIWDQTLSPHQCVSCGDKRFFSAENQSCMDCDVGCSACVETSSKCSACNENWYLQKDSPSCLQYCLSTSAGSLTFANKDTHTCVFNGSCPNSFYANSTTRFCEPCSSNCSVCYGPTSNDCTKCADGYYLLAGTTSCKELGDYMRWAEPDTWPSLTVPANSSSTDVTILPNMSVLLDTNVVCGSLIIEGGRLHIETQVPITLEVSRIYIKGGTFSVGSANAPLTVDFTILFNGMSPRESLNLTTDTYTNLTDLNKRANVFINVGKVIFYSGTSTMSAWSRLADPLSPGGKSLSVRSAVQWKKSNSANIINVPTQNSVVITSSSFSSSDSEVINVDNIDGTTISLASGATYYHHGAPSGAGMLTNGNESMHLSAEVGVRAHKIRMISTDVALPLIVVNTHQVLNSTDLDTGLTTSIDTFGIWSMFGVSFENAGDPTGKYGAVNYLGLTSTNLQAIFPSDMTGCTIWNSKGPGVLINNSRRINFTRNFIFNSSFNSIRIANSDELNITQNLIVSKQTVGTISNSTTSFFLQPVNLQTTTVSIYIQSNVIVGDKGISYLMQAGRCSGSGLVFKNNTAHSGNIGWLAIASPTDCAVLSHFKAYKMQEGIIAYPQSNSMEANNLILSDNKNSLTMNLGFQGFMNQMTLSESLLAGFGFENCDSCYLTSDSCSDISGIRLSTITQNSLTRLDQNPLYAPTSNGIFYQKVLIKNVTFMNFFESLNDLSIDSNGTTPIARLLEIETGEESNTTNESNSTSNLPPNITLKASCSNNRLFVSNKYATDYIALHNLTKSNVSWVAMNSVFNSQMTSPLDSTFFAGDVGGLFNYSALYNYLIVDSDGAFFRGVNKSYNSSEGRTIIPNNPQAVNSSNCKFHSAWNGYDCASNYGLLTFSNLGADRYTSRVSPIYVNNSIQALNVLTLGGDYTSTDGSQRQPQWTAVVEKNQVYMINYTDTTPSYVQYQLQGAEAEDWLILRILLVKSKSVQVMVGNKIVQPFIKSPTGRQYLQDLITKSCGTNMVQTFTESVQNSLENPYIEVYLTGASSCVVNVQFVTGVYLQTKIDLDIDTFAQTVGTDSFKDALSKALQVSPSRICIYSISQGSTIVEYIISSDNTLSTTSQQLENLNTTTQALIDISNAGTLKFQGKGIQSNMYMITSSSSSGVQVNTPTTVVETNYTSSGGGGSSSGGSSSGSNPSEVNQATDTKSWFQEYGLFVILGSVAGLVVVFAAIFCCCMKGGSAKVSSDSRGDTTVDEDEEIVAKMRMKSSGRIASSPSSSRNHSRLGRGNPSLVL